MEFGKTLREAREAKGYTIAQLAEMTHIYARSLEALEAEDFREIPAPIYGRGFVKLCCQHLGLDPNAMVDEFMAIYNGEKPAHRSEIPIPPAAAATPAASVPVADIPEPPDGTETPISPEAPESCEAPVDEPEPPLPQYGDLFNQPADPAPAPTPSPAPTPAPAMRRTPSRFAPPQPHDDEGGRRLHLEMPDIPWRLVMLSVAAVAILWIAIAGCRAVYRALSTPADPAPDRTPAAEMPPDGSAPSAPAATPRTPKPVSPLYID